jgi:methyl-accepting chemotaxis protein
MSSAPTGLRGPALTGTSGLSSFDAPPPLPQVETAVLGDAASFDGVPGLAGGEVLALVRPLGLEGLDWTLVAERDRGAAMAPVGALALRLLAGAAVAVAIAAAVGWWASRRVAAPLGQLAQAARAVAERRADPAVPAAAGTDELAELARALATLRDDLARADEVAAEREVARRGQDLMVAELGAALSRLAQGGLTTPVEAPFAQEHDRLRQDVNATMSELSEILSTVVDRARQISQKASEISSASDDLSRRTENQAATLEETAAALDELTASVKSSAQGAAEVDGIVAKAREEAERSGEVVRHAVTAMAEIERSSDEIGQIIGVIDDIAFQTNVLALNAGVEAARAGEAGRGFAVVASEVRTLAQRSSDAARQIKELIGGSATQVRRGVGLVGKAGSALTSITDRVAHIAELVSDIASGAREQAAGLGEINNGVNQLDQVTQQNAAMVEEATSASHVLTQDARQFAELVARFRLPESAAPKVTAAPPPAPRIRAVAPRLEATTGRPVAEDDWEEF